MRALRRITYTPPTQTQTIHRQIQRHFTNINPKAIPQLSRRDRVSTKTNRIKVEREEEEYSRLLDSKLDSCPPQPFNEKTNILWGAVYDTVQRRNKIELMSRWEQIQRGYIRPETCTLHERNTYYDHEAMENMHGRHGEYRFVDTIIDVNDILQTHDSLDEIVHNHNSNNHNHNNSNSKPVRCITLGKSTGSLHSLLDNPKDIFTDREKTKGQIIKIKMRNDLKWKKRQMRLHIKKKRRENLRFKKKTMQQRNQRNDS